jgi:hypothetical protein
VLQGRSRSLGKVQGGKCRGQRLRGRGQGQRSRCKGMCRGQEQGAEVDAGQERQQEQQLLQRMEPESVSSHEWYHGERKQASAAAALSLQDNSESSSVFVSNLASLWRCSDCDFLR